ncbi:MAG: HEAT repeat domain-containing protein [Bryobacteraceae bacterium]
MNCGEGERWLAAYLDGALDEPARRDFEQHLAVCTECRDSVEVWARLGELPEPVPSGRLRRRFEQDLARETARVQAASGFWLPVPRYAGWAMAACLLVAVGWAAGRMSRPAQPEVGELRQEVRHLKTLVTLSLLGQQSATERLKGIGYADEMREESRDVLDALISALKYDSSVNVRLAACDALRRHGSDARVRRAFVDALAVEESPLGKVALIDTLVELREKESVRALARLRSLPGEDDDVKARAARALEQLNAKGAVWKE